MKSKLPKSNKNSENKKYVKLFLVVFLIFAIFVLAYIILKATGLWEKVNSIEKIRKIVESGGVFSFVIFIILQILQTTILQIPAIIVTVAGTLIFGRWTAFVLSFFSVVLGSLIMFWIGRKCGRKFLNWLCGKEEADGWIKKISHGKYLFFLMMMFPLFPDDILCVVAGVTDMSFSFFFWTNILSRGLGIACTVFFGSGTVIPFHGWGLLIWGVIAIFVLGLFYLSIKYQDKIDELLKNFFKKRK